MDNVDVTECVHAQSVPKLLPNQSFGLGLAVGLVSAWVMVWMAGLIKQPATPVWSANMNRARLVMLAGFLLLTGTLGFSLLDGQTWVDAFYCTCITLSTVGYGDICPAKQSVEIKIFIVCLALSGLGLFCGPFLDMMAGWKDLLYKDDIGRVRCVMAVLLAVITVGTALFTGLEGWELPEALYFSVITGTTIGYGDHPKFKTNAGKIAASVFALLSINVIGFVVSALGDVLSVALTGSKAENMKRYQLLGLAALLLFVGTLGFAFLDDQRWVDAFYCSCITLCTVGYGDICPSTPSLYMKVFVVLLSLSGLGVFSGPFLDLTAQWKEYLRFGNTGFVHVIIVFMAVVGASVALFTTLEGWDAAEAAYFAVITGTTIGYGDHPQFKTDAGKLAASVFALLTVNVLAYITPATGSVLSRLVEVPTKDT